MIAEPLLAREVPSVVVLYKTREELDVLVPLLEACGVDLTAIATDQMQPGYDYSLWQYDYSVLTDPELFEEVMSYDKPLFCVGPGFDKIKGIQIKTLESVQVERAFAQLKQEAKFIEALTVIEAYEGEAFGRVSIALGSEYPMCIRTGEVVYIPYVEKDDLSAFVFGSMWQRSMDKVGQGRLYVGIEEVNPFSDFDKLCKVSDSFYRYGIPFVVKVRPVYEHIDYPAFRRYTQVLRYVQSRGGCIIFDDPIEDINGARQKTSSEKIAYGRGAFEAEGIVLRHFENLPYQMSLDTLKALDSKTRQFPILDFDVVIQYSMEDKTLEVEEMIKAINDQWLTIEDLEASFSNRTYAFDEVQLGQEEHLYDAEEMDIKYETLFKVIDKILIVIVVASIVIFGVIIKVGYRLYKAKYYKNHNDI